MPDIENIYDDDEGYADGDIDLADLDPAELERVQALLDEVHEHPEGPDRNLAALGALTALYGDDLEIV